MRLVKLTMWYGGGSRVFRAPLKRARRVRSQVIDRIEMESADDQFEIVDDRREARELYVEPQAQAFYAQQSFAPQVNVVVHNHIGGGAGVEHYSRGTAAVLSLFIPGAGQMYKGQVFNGLCWFLIVGVGYIFIIPGVVLHLFCILGAASGTGRR